MAKLDETLFTVMEVFMRFADCDVVLTHQKTMFLKKKHERTTGRKGRKGRKRRKGRKAQKAGKE